MNLTISFECLTELVPGSGMDVPGLVDLEVRHDRYGFPYLFGKTIKGCLREKMLELIDLTVTLGSREDDGLRDELKAELLRHFYLLMGSGQNGNCSFAEESNKLRFDNCMLAPDLRVFLQYLIQEKRLSADDMLNALTSVRSFTAMEDGRAKKGSLRNYRVFNPGLKLFCNVTREGDLDATDYYFLAGGLRLLKSIGTMRNRGKGQILTRLHREDVEITENCISEYLKRFGGRSE